MAQLRKIPGSKRALREAKKRDRNQRSLMIRCRYLIACEGKETEPNYFKELNQKIPRDIAIIAKGDGCNTLSLVQWAEAEKNNYEHNAISRAKKLWENKDVIPSRANPTTGVFELVEILNKYFKKRID